jgi:hypothetical protein
VILVPGIKGSTLRDEYPTTPETVWSLAQAVMSAYDRITLHPYNVHYEAREPARVVRDQVFSAFYSEFIEELRHNLTMQPENPVPVFPFAYDWRQPLAAVQLQLEAFIEEVIARTSLLPHYNKDGFNTTTGKVSLIGHSMGGLIIAGHLAGEGWNRVDRVATIASPFRGSLEAVALTTTGTSTLTTGGSREREAARVTPALYHLLPSFDGCVDDEPDEVLFDATKWQTTILQTLDLFIQQNKLPNAPPLTSQDLLSGMLSQAKAHRDSLEGLKVPDPARWLCIAGLDSDTRVEMSITTDDNGQIRFLVGDAENQFQNGRTPGKRSRTGDGTVPYLGAQCGFIPKEQMICVTPDDYEFFEIKDKLFNKAVGLHANLPNMNLVQRLVISHLLQRQQGTLGGCPGPDVSDGDWNPPFPKNWLKG